MMLNEDSVAQTEAQNRLMKAEAAAKRWKVRL